ncbi:nucleic acid-binding, OB-fold protein [Tanacetum coccineum]
MPTTLRLKKERWKTSSFRLGIERMIVKIDGIRSRKGWNFLGCGGEKCKKGVVRKDRSFWCQACEKAVDYPVMRYRLELVTTTSASKLTM